MGVQNIYQWVYWYLVDMSMWENFFVPELLLGSTPFLTILILRELLPRYLKSFGYLWWYYFFLRPLDTDISFKDWKLVYHDTFKMTHLQIYREQAFILDGWKARMYSTMCKGNYGISQGTYLSSSAKNAFKLLDLTLEPYVKTRISLSGHNGDELNHKSMKAMF